MHVPFYLSQNGKFNENGPLSRSHDHFSNNLNLNVLFYNMGRPLPLLFIFHCKAFYNDDLQTGHSIETFPHL